MIRYIILWGIRLYWLIPSSKRRECIFSKSCSCEVYDQAYSKGVIAGLKALWKRYKQCRGGYIIYSSEEEGDWVLLSNGDTISREHLKI